MKPYNQMKFSSIQKTFPSSGIVLYLYATQSAGAVEYTDCISAEG